LKNSIKIAFISMMRFKFWLLIIDFRNCWHALLWRIRAPKQPSFLKKEGNMIEAALRGADMVGI